MSSTYLTINDLDWTIGMQPRNWTIPLNFSLGSGYDYELNDTGMHFFETTGTYDVWVGAHAIIPIENEGLRITFNGRARANHIDAVSIQMLVYHPETLMLIYYWDVIHKTGDLDTGYLSFDFPILFEGFHEVILFLGFGDGHTANWNKENWVRDLKLYNEFSEEDIVSEEIPTVFSSNYSNPRGIYWKDEAIWSLAGRGYTYDKIFKYDAQTGDVLMELDIDYHPYDITFDGEYFWVSEGGGTVLRKYDSFLNLVDTFALPFEAWGGLAFDGQYLWVVNFYDDLIYKIERYSGNVLDTILTPGLRDVSLEFDGECLISCDYFSNHIIRFSPTNGSIIEIYELPLHKGWGITLDDNKNVWISDIDGKLIYKLNLVLNGSLEEPPEEPPEEQPTVTLSISVFVLIVPIFVLCLFKIKKRKQI
ncbi:MAG: hypothetical protein H7641_00600 [Candidatus Heimdallarchaeota archaeon]|nr:hypothetical protein [Candidatus Heimdallarchaeota archaeon]MCK4876065.1 hypothetical protein [Candidatus Heimdallarchaeota archaeon]